MCGIVGYTGKRKASHILIEGLSRLEYRGYDSAGIAVNANGKVNIKKATGKIQNLRDATNDGEAIEGFTGIGHTRWATHGAPCERNSHPHLSNDGKFAVVHNGIIENYTELKKELVADGYHFVSDTDTEVVPVLLEKYYKGSIFEALSKTVSRLEGSFALGIISVYEPDTVFAVRRSAPLIVGIKEGENFIASDVTALVSHTKNVIYIEDNEIAVLKPESVSFYDLDGNKIEKSVSLVDWDIESAEKGGYAHFMLKEIHEQPKALRQTIDCRIKKNKVVFEGVKLNAEKLKSIKQIYIVACGSAYHAGMVGKYVIEELVRIPVQVDIASEFRYRNPIVDENTLVIIISQSGETADTLEALRISKRNGAHTLSIVNVVGSSIAKESDDVIYTWAGPEIAVATTKGYSTQVSVLYLFAIWAAERLSTRDSGKLYALLNEVRALPDKIEEILSREDEIKSLAEKCGKPESMFFIGRNIDYAVALEASLKLKEISYVHSEAYAAGELKHGTISLIEPGRLVIALNCYSRLSEKLLSNLKEVKARGAHVLSSATVGNKAIAAESDEVIFLPETDELLAASLEVIPFQLYAYYVALFNGCDIDKPRNLAKSVTVE